MFKFITDLFKPGTDLAQLIQQGAIIVDVRSSAEFDAGHAKGSTNIPLDRIRMAAAGLKKAEPACHYGLPHRQPQQCGPLDACRCRHRNL